MNNVESIKWIVYGNKFSDVISNTDTKELIDLYGYNRAIASIAGRELIKVLENPKSINDGAVSMSWEGRSKALEDIIKKAELGLFNAPEPDTKDNPIAWSTEI